MVRQIEDRLERAEELMCASRLYQLDQIRPVNELRMRGRWKLGKLLEKIDRAHGPGRGKKMSAALTSFRASLGSLTLDRQTALEAQRIGHLPEPELEKAFTNAHKLDILNT